jgi:linoleoyl-CoA desaturase
MGPAQTAARPETPSPAGRGKEPGPTIDRNVHPAESGSRPKFPKGDGGLLAELRRRVDAYFRHSGRRERDCWQMYLKTAVVLSWFAASYVLLVFFAQVWWQGLALAVSLAFAMAAIGFNIQHDGGHNAYSRANWMNKLAAMTLDLIGASSYLWRWKHVVFHHTYANVTGVDTDIDAGSVARLSPHQRPRRFHRWQHLYLWLLYGISASRWHLYGDFKEVITGTCGPHRIPRPKGWDLVVFLLGKVTSVGLLLALPMFWHPWWVVLLFYLFVTGLLGVTLSIVFQLAHCVEEADFPVPDRGTLWMNAPWAVHQVRTTVDFARKSRVLAWLLGGLNFQIEHHLFPRVCHVHYPALSQIVEETCKEFGVKYSVHKTFRAGLASHYRWLRRMGQVEPK